MRGELACLAFIRDRSGIPGVGVGLLRLRLLPVSKSPGMATAEWCHLMGFGLQVGGKWVPDF